MSGEKGGTMNTALILAAFLLFQGQDVPPTPAEADPPSLETAPSTIDGKHRIRAPPKTKEVPPEWPANARRAGLDGEVELECNIDQHGRVQDTKVLKGYRALASAATAAVRKWRYKPTVLDDTPVAVKMTVTIHFKLTTPPGRDDLIDSLRDSDPEIRWAAVRWLGRYRPVVAKQKVALERALADADEVVRNAAQEALAKLEAQ